MIRILIVEDEITIARLIDLNLSACGYECTCEYDGLAAADLLEQMSFDLILLDIMLPGADGFELMDLIRPTKTPVIFLTARGSVSDRVNGLRAGERPAPHRKDRRPVYRRRCVHRRTSHARHTRRRTGSAHAEGI